MLLRQFILWRARRKLRRERYQLDNRSYNGVFGPGFFAFLSGTRFWESTNDYHQPHGRLIRRLTSIIAVVGSLFLLWVLYISFKALEIFN